MPVTKEELAQMIDVLAPQKSTFNPLDAEFDVGSLERPAPSGELLDELSPPAPAPKPAAPAKAEGELTAEEAETLKESLEFAEFQKAKQFDQRMKAFVQRHKIIPNSPINESIFGQYLQAIQFNGDVAQITDERLEEFFESSSELLERQDNTPPPLNPNRPTVVYLPDSQRPRPIQTALPSGHQGPSPESEMTQADVAAKIANMPIEQARRYMTALMRQQIKGRQ